MPALRPHLARHGAHARAQSLNPEPQEALLRTEKARRTGGAFSATDVRRTFRTCMTDICKLVLLSHRINHLQRQAPGVSVEAEKISDDSRRRIESAAHPRIRASRARSVPGRSPPKGTRSRPRRVPATPSSPRCWRGRRSSGASCCGCRVSWAWRAPFFNADTGNVWRLRTMADLFSGHQLGA